MTTDCAFPCNNKSVILAVALDELMENWDMIRKKGSDAEISRYYATFVSRIKKLQKEGKLNKKIRNMRSLEEVKNAI